MEKPARPWLERKYEESLPGRRRGHHYRVQVPVVARRFLLTSTHCYRSTWDAWARSRSSGPRRGRPGRRPHPKTSGGARGQGSQHHRHLTLRHFNEQQQQRKRGKGASGGNRAASGKRRSLVRFRQRGPSWGRGEPGGSSCLPLGRAARACGRRREPGGFVESGAAREHPREAAR